MSAVELAGRSEASHAPSGAGAATLAQAGRAPARPHIAAPGGADTIDRQWGLVAASNVGLIFSVGTLLVYTFGIFVGPLSAEWGWTRTQLAVALAISHYALAASSPAWGFLIDRFGPRPAIVFSVVCLSALFASLALLGPGIWQFYLVFAAISVLAGGSTPLGYCAVLVRRFDRHLGLALGLALIGAGIGGAALPPLAQALVSALGWRGAYAVLGALTLAITLPAGLAATAGVGRGGARRAEAATVPVLPLVLGWPFAFLCIIFCLLGAAVIGALTSIVPMMTGLGFTPAAAAQVAALTGFVAIIGRGGVGWVLDRVHPPYVVAFAACLALASFLLLTSGNATVAPYLTAVLLGSVVGAEVDFAAYLTRYYFGDAVFGRVYGLIYGVFILGSGTGPVLASMSFDRYGSYRPAALLFAAASLVVAVLMLVAPKRRIPGPAADAG